MGVQACALPVSGGSTLAIGLPAGTASGDVMVAHVIVRTAGNAIAAPAGWNPVLRQDSSSSIATATYEKVAGSSEPASYTWSFSIAGDRKSTRLNSSHTVISYAVFCLQNKNNSNTS